MANRKLIGSGAPVTFDWPAPPSQELKRSSDRYQGTEDDAQPRAPAGPTHNDPHRLVAEFLQKVTGGDESRASFILAVMCLQRNDLSGAENHYRRAAELGLVDATFNLGVLAAERSDFASAAEYFNSAAKRGLPEAQYNLGLLYFEGKGLPRNYDAAFELFKLAAGQGQPDAHYMLGQMYEHGKGDLVNARKHYEAAARLGIKTVNTA